MRYDLSTTVEFGTGRNVRLYHSIYLPNICSRMSEAASWTPWRETKSYAFH